MRPRAIAERIDAVAQRIAGARLERLLVVAILKGSFVFAADLLRAMHRAGLSPEVDFLTLASYREATRSAGKSGHRARHRNRCGRPRRSHR